MRRDVQPAPFASLERLIEDYIYGSAIVVGYFLMQIYGNAPTASLQDALACARELAIALQLTNFARDVYQDHLAGRLYLPVDLLEAQGIPASDCMKPEYEPELRQVIGLLAREADRRYDYARARVNVFAEDCRVAISACIEIYQRLNEKFRNGEAPVRQRISLGFGEKFQVLPPAKYWRVPLALTGLL